MGSSTKNEAKYLRSESKRAKDDMGKALKGIKQDATSAISARRLIGKHPWISLGAAVTLGFVAAGLFDRSRHAESYRPQSFGPEPGSNQPPHREKINTLRKWIARARTIVGIIKPMIEGFLAVYSAVFDKKEEAAPSPEQHAEH